MSRALLVAELIACETDVARAGSALYVESHTSSPSSNDPDDRVLTSATGRSVVGHYLDLRKYSTSVQVSERQDATAALKGGLHTQSGARGSGQMDNCPAVLMHFTWSREHGNNNLEGFEHIDPPCNQESRSAARLVRKTLECQLR